MTIENKKTAAIFKFKGYVKVVIYLFTSVLHLIKVDL
ncbi:MAG: hypothetical protein PWQ54_405 [Bacteroidales bacterium]|jgi:hypothetical protein|nr:hypothetical protein [Bacteroidales bacterium]